LLPLTFDWTALNNKVDAMQPNGMTNVTIGLVWAWHALTTQAPLSEASAPAADLDKVIILLTDGENTEAWNNSTNSKTTNVTTIDSRTSQTCTNIKAANIKLYTIRVIDGNASLLQQCATRSDMYFDVQNASQLDKVFTQIGQSLANLRIAK
jgi:Mg-chelatase subunit ChlD